MENRDFFLSIIDLLLVTFLVLMLAFLAIRHDSSKGFGELDFIVANPLGIESGDQGEGSAYTFYAFVLFEDSIELHRYDQGKEAVHGSYASVDELRLAQPLNEDIPRLVYEVDSSKHFAGIVRLLTEAGTNFGIVVRPGE